MEKMKIIHVYKSFNVYNGLIEILTIMAQNMDHSRYELGVCVYEYNGNDFGKKFMALGGKIYNLQIPQTIGNKHKEFFSLYDFFMKHKPDIVQTHVLKANLYGTLAAKLAKVPVVITTEMTLKDIAPSKGKRFRDHVIQPLASLIIDKSDRFVVTSQFIKGEWERSVKKDRFEVIYPPFNLEKYDEAKKNQHSQTKSVGKRIGFVGRLSEEKSVGSLLRAMVNVVKTHSDCHLVIVGTGPMEKELKKQCSELNLDKVVKFEGYRSNSFEALSEMDLFVLPSRTEGCPIVVLEAMAMGLPVIATNVGGNPELVVPGETGYLIPPDNPQIMGDAISRLLSQSELARKLGQNGRNRAFSHFHPSIFTNKLQELYCHLTKEKMQV